MEKILPIIFALIFTVLPLHASGGWYYSVGVSINNRQVNFAGQEPVIVNGRTLVPVRDVFEQLNFSVQWNSEGRQVTMRNNTYIVVLIVGSNTFYINGVAHFLEVPAQIIGDSTMVPLRAIIEGVGYRLRWNGQTRTVEISTGDSVRDFVYFYQRDARWADVPFGSFTTARGGCGPTVLAMVVSTLRGENVYPGYVVTWGARFYVDGIGAAHSLFTSEVTHRHFGLAFRPIEIHNNEEVLAALHDGALIVTSVQAINSPNARAGAQELFVIDPMAGGGHIAVIYGVTESGNVLVASPRYKALLENTEGWPLDVVRNELHRGIGQFWAFTLE